MKRNEIFYKAKFIIIEMRGGLVVERWTSERDVRGSIFTQVAVLYP